MYHCASRHTRAKKRNISVFIPTTIVHYNIAILCVGYASQYHRSIKDYEVSKKKEVPKGKKKPTIRIFAPYMKILGKNENNSRNNNKKYSARLPQFVSIWLCILFYVNRRKIVILSRAQEERKKHFTKKTIPYRTTMLYRTFHRQIFVYEPYVLTIVPIPIEPTEKLYLFFHFQIRLCTRGTV